MKKFFLSAVLLIYATSLILGQSDVTVSRKEFRTSNPGFDAAWKHVNDGDSFYSKGGIWYANAVTEYKAATIYNNNNAELNYKLGVSCLYSEKKELASEFLLKALKLKPDVSADVLLMTGRSLQFAGNYKEAALKINEWLALGIKKDPDVITRANKYLAECKSAESLLKDTLKAEIRNLGRNINSMADEYSEVVSRKCDRMYFASRRETGTNPMSYYSDSKFDENIYLSDLENGIWGASLPAGKYLKTDFCETPLDMDSSGTILYIYAGYEGNGDIMVSELKKGEWRTPEPESFGFSSSDPETSFTISPSGREVAFVSDRGRKGAGGKDVYFVYKNDRKWSKPVNAGAGINSDANEESVRYSRGGDTLWFSSSGHNTAGGFDIFYSIRNADGTWAQAVNAGYPLNTSWDEFFYLPSPVNDSLFYFVSNRKGGFGGLDIYSGRIIAAAKPKVTEAIPGSRSDSIPGSVIQKQDSVRIKDGSSGRNMNIK